MIDGSFTGILGLGEAPFLKTLDFTGCTAVANNPDPNPNTVLRLSKAHRCPHADPTSLQAPSAELASLRLHRGRSIDGIKSWYERLKPRFSLP